MILSTVNGKFGLEVGVPWNVIATLEKHPLHPVVRKALNWSILPVAIFLIVAVALISEELFNLGRTFNMRDFAVTLPMVFLSLVLIVLYAGWATREERRFELRRRANSYEIGGVYPSWTYVMRALKLDVFTQEDLGIGGVALRLYFEECSRSKPFSFPESPEYTLQRYDHAIAVCDLAEDVLNKLGRSTAHLERLREEARVQLEADRRSFMTGMKPSLQLIKQIDDTLNHTR